MLRRFLLLVFLTLLAGGVVYGVVRWQRQPSMPDVGGTTGVAVAPLAPGTARTGVAECDDYVSRICACTVDRPGLAGSAARRCEVARLAATTWRERLGAPSDGGAAEAVRVECQRLLADLARLHPDCRAAGARP